MKLTENLIKMFQKEILSWYSAHHRDLPWREIPFDSKGRQRDPYKILISEVMSQQTQISRVIPKYEAWLQRFPTVQSLADAPTSDVLKYWSGLGYNRRAVNLQRAAKVIITEYNGEFPSSVDELKKLPGIGEYTASAVACFAFDEQIAVVDTNVRKVILKKVLQTDDEKVAVTDAEIKAIAEQLLPLGQAYAWNQALMDYASATLKHEKIPIPKQSTFKGSNRYYRGQIIKLLIEHKGISLKYLGEILGKDEVFMEKIVCDLKKEGLIMRNQDLISLP